MIRPSLCALIALSIGCFAQAKKEAPPNPDTTVIDADGTARITRVVPVPKTISPEAQAHLATGATWAPGPNSPEFAKLIDKARAMYPVKEEDATMGGVKVRIFSPAAIPAAKRDRVLINLHGGGFRVDSGSHVESIPIANLTQTKVISVYYRLAPKDTFPAAVDDVIAVYKEVLKTYQPRNIAIFGTSAGASLTAQAAVRIKHDGLPLPASLGIFTVRADFSKAGDSEAFFAVPGLMGATVPNNDAQNVYLGSHDPKDPMASVVYANWKGFPPALLITGTRDLLMSDTINLHRVMLAAGMDAKLVVYDAMPHAFWYMIGIPESKEALEKMAKFFDETVGKKK